MESQRITKVSTIHPEGNMNVCSKVCASLLKKKSENFDLVVAVEKRSGDHQS